MKKRIIFRADGNQIIGFGHFYRLLALADILRDDFICLFAINYPDENQRKQIATVCHSIIELQIKYEYVIPDLLGIHNQMPFDLHGWVTNEDIVVIDGYQFLDQYQIALNKEGCEQVFIDDFQREYPFANSIINHAPGLKKSGGNNKNHFYSGLDYAILRKPFFSQFIIKEGMASQHIYVSLGGADFSGRLVKVCKGLYNSGKFSKLHVVCPVNIDPVEKKLLEAMEQRKMIVLYKSINAEKIIEIMNDCVYAFVVASTVLVESYARGLYCYTGFLSENQHLLYNGFVNENLAMGVGDIRLLTEKKISSLIQMSHKKALINLQTPLSSVANLKDIFQTIRNRHA